LVGCSALTGNVWNGQLLLFQYGLSPKSDGITMKEIQKVQTRSGITAVDFAGKTSTPLVLAGNDNAILECLQVSDDEKANENSDGEGLPIIPKPVCSLVGHEEIISSMSVQRSSASGWGSGLLTSSWDETIKLWDLAKSCQAISTWKGHIGHVHQVKFSKHNPNCFVSAGEDGCLLLWDTRTPAICGGSRLTRGEVVCVDTSNDSQHCLVYGTSTGNVIHADSRNLIWKITGKKHCERKYRSDTISCDDRVNCIAFSARSSSTKQTNNSGKKGTDYVAYGSYDRTVTIASYSGTAGQIEHGLGKPNIIRKHSGAVSTLAWIPTAPAKEREECENSVSFKPRDTLIVASWDKKLSLLQS